MALNTCEMWSNSIKIAFFQKITKNRPAAGALPPDPHSLWRLRAVPPDPPL